MTLCGSFIILIKTLSFQLCVLILCRPQLQILLTLNRFAAFNLKKNASTLQNKQFKYRFEDNSIWVPFPVNPPFRLPGPIWYHLSCIKGILFAVFRNSLKPFRRDTKGTKNKVVRSRRKCCYVFIIIYVLVWYSTSLSHC